MFRRLIDGLVEILYPGACPACKRRIKGRDSAELVCAGCWNAIQRNLPPFCHSCGRQLQKTGFSKSICPQCVKKKLHFDRAFSPCAYEGVVKNLIHEFKYKGKDYLGRPLSRLMIDFIKEYNLPLDYVDYIIPVPLHQAKKREREFNQSEVLSGFIGREFNKAVAPDSLIRLRRTKTQAGLGIEERLKNVTGSFSAGGKPALRGKNILLVDDVLTSGATSSEASLALKNAGANIVFVLTLAN